jgi:hypothetical protein
MSLEHAPRQFLRRKQAAEYLTKIYGFGAVRTLNKFATIGGGPEMIYAGRVPLYTLASLDAWALSRMSGPVRSTSEKRKLAQAQHEAA